MNRFKILNLPLILFFCGAFVFSLNSCSKKGCTDPDADNFNADAGKDDGTCNFSGRVMFWFNGQTADSLYYNYSDYLNITVDGQNVGQYTSDLDSDNSAPDCGTSGRITVEKDLGSDKTKLFTYSVVDEDGNQIWGGNLEFTANTCERIELTW